MQTKVYQYVKKIIEDKGLKGKTLDIGSLDVNGSLKELFDDYTGLDMRDGKNVDVVSNSHSLPFKNETFDIVTCVETLEHDDNPFKTLNEIHRVLKRDGYVILAASGINFPKHSYPNDYWRFTGEAFKVLMEDFKYKEAYDDESESFGFGQK